MLKLGSRGSTLAMTQTRTVAAGLVRVTGEEEPTIQSFVTTGDRIADRRLSEAGGKGLFTKELDEALLDGRIDAAVHSLKDLPTTLPDGIVLAAIPSREDPRDAFISSTARDLKSLPESAVVGTASLRRQAQTLHLRPDLRIVTLRGSLETRLRRLSEGVVDATFLALAGLNRMGFKHHATTLIDSREMPPAPGQGALAVTCRADDENTRALFAKLTIEEFETAVAAERGFLAALDGSCRTPIAALAKVSDGMLDFLGEVLAPDGSKRWRREEKIALSDNPRQAAEALGKKLGAAIRAEAGEVFIQSLEKRGW